MQLIKKFNKGFRFLLCVIDIYSKYTWVIPLKDKKGIAITHPFQKMLDESKQNKICIDKGSKFYNRSMKSFLSEQWYRYVCMYSRHNERKSVIADGFMGTLKNRICKYMTSMWKNVHINKLN